MNVKNRTVFSNDNLPVLRGIDTESVDLIYLDPPFNSNRNYAAPIGSTAAGAAFKDTWTLSDVDNAWHGEIADREPALYQAIHAAELTHGKGMKSYLIMMTVRLLEMKRVLKKTGSIYLHCDPTASHYLKMLSWIRMFGKNNFKNEIVWKRANSTLIMLVQTIRAVYHGGHIADMLRVVLQQSSFGTDRLPPEFSPDTTRNPEEIQAS